MNELNSNSWVSSEMSQLSNNADEVLAKYFNFSLTYTYVQPTIDFWIIGFLPL